MAHYENTDLGVSFDLPDSPNALTVLTYDSIRLEIRTSHALIILWECIKPIIENWQCEFIPDVNVDLSSINGKDGLRGAKVVKYVGIIGSDWRIGLELVSKNS